MDKLIKKLANTVIANLHNTAGIGLFDGKMGIAIFLYEYARYSKRDIYNDVAGQLLDDIYSQVSLKVSPNLLEGSAGIGWGLCYLLQHQFIEGDPDEVLHDLDEHLLNQPLELLLAEMACPTPLYSSGIYLLSRLPLCHDEKQKKKWINSIIEAGIFFIVENVKEKHLDVKLSLINSMLWVFKELPKNLIECSENVLPLQRDLLSLSMDSIKKELYQDVDMVLSKQIWSSLSTKRCRNLEEVSSSLLLKIDSREEWNEYLWWCLIYSQTVFHFDGGKVEEYVKQKMENYGYEMKVINNQYSILGLYFMKYKDGFS